ncbi:hypothetical protein VPHF89G1_0042 [Vibrio phage F89 g1]
MIEFLKQHRAKCAKESKLLGFWWSSQNLDLMG